MENGKGIENQRLWQAFRSGDQWAFDELLRQHYTMLLRYGIRLVADRRLTEDCLHDFFVDLWRRRSHLGEAKSIQAYLLSSFRRRLLREKSKTATTKTTSPNEADFDVEFSIETNLIQDEQKQETIAKLQQQLQQLTKRQQEAIYLRFYQGLEYDDIAEIMFINNHSVVNLVYDALKMLRKHWIPLLLIFMR